MTWPEVTWPEVTSFPPAFFSYYSSSTKCPIVVCHSIYSFWLFLLVSFGQCVVLSFDLRLLIIPLVSSNLSCKGTFCTTTIVRKKRRKITSLPVMTSLSVMRLVSLPVMTSLPVAHLSQIMMIYRSSKQLSTYQTPSISPQPPPPPPFTDYIRYVTSPLRIKKDPSYLNLYKILRYKNVPKYYLVQDAKTPDALSKLSFSKLPGTKRIKKWKKLR